MIKTQYETEKKEKENLKLKQENTEKQLQIELENKHKWYLGIGLLGTIITLGVFLFYYQRNKKQKKIIENLQKELHHRIKNNLSIIDAFIDTTKGEVEDEVLEGKLVELQNRIESINQVHEQLYSSSDVVHLNLKTYIEKLVNNVQQSFSKNDITVDKDIDPKLNLQADISFPVGLIINEFITNSYKYAFSEGEKGNISVNIEEHSKAYILSLSDNGKGLPIDFNIETNDSFGLDVIQLLTKQLKGVFSIDGSSGVNLLVEFPK